MEGQSGEGAARKRRRSESKEEELEALAASTRRREDNAGKKASAVCSLPVAYLNFVSFTDLFLFLQEVFRV